MSDTLNHAAAGELPQLPESRRFVMGYSACDMQDYARAAIAADRAQLARNGAQGEPMAYAIFRAGKQVGVERTKQQADGWVDAQIVPLCAAPRQGSDAELSVIVELARAVTDTHCDSLPSEPTKEYSNAYLFRTLTRAAPQAPKACADVPVRSIFDDLSNRVYEAKEAAYTFGDNCREAVEIALGGVIDMIDEAFKAAAPLPVQADRGGDAAAGAGELSPGDEKARQLAEALSIEYSPVVITWGALIWAVKALAASPSPSASPDQRLAALAQAEQHCSLCDGSGGHRAGCPAPTDEQIIAALPVELIGVREEIAEGSGFWSSCSGCHDTEDGHPTGPYSYSRVFGCALGSGCSECGGIGAVWDNTDYEEIAHELGKDETPSPSAPQVQETAHPAPPAPHSQGEKG